MKAMVCEMCQSNDLIKKEGIYVCQYCGTKYTVEEARNLFVEGSVKIDNSEFIEKYLQNARRAKAKQDWAETEKYYNLVEQNEPNNIEAIFYSAFGKAKSSLVDADLYKRQAAFKVLQNCISIVDDNYEIEYEDSQKKILHDISIDIFDMAASEYVYNVRKDGYGIETWSDKLETVTLFNNLSAEFMSTLENIANKYPNEQMYKRVFFYELALKHVEYILIHGHLAYPDGMQKRFLSYHKLLKDINPDHVIPTEIPASSSSGACYIATSVYGSYNCPQVWTLRRFRDNTLAESWYGRTFIRIYYAISPTLLKWFGKTKWFTNLWKAILDCIITNLNKNGISDMPYDDREW